MLVVPACVVLAGCSSGPEKTAGEERSAMAVGGLKETRGELVAAKAQINKTLSVMNAMRDGQGALPTEFAAYNAELKKNDEQAAKTRKRAADMQARSKQYQAKWREEMGKVEDPTLRAAAAERANKVGQSYKGITAKANEAKAAYQPFVKQLKSVQTYLSNDLTPAGVQSAGPVFDKATADGKVVNEKLDAVIAELDKVATELNPAAAAPAKK